MAGISALASFLLGIYAYQKNQQMGNLTENLNNLKSEYNQKVEKLTNKRNLLYNQVQNFQNTLEDVENNLENNLDLSGDTYLNLCNQTSNDIIDAFLCIGTEKDGNHKDGGILKRRMHKSLGRL